MRCCTRRWWKIWKQQKNALIMQWLGLVSFVRNGKHESVITLNKSEIFSKKCYKSIRLHLWLLSKKSIIQLSIKNMKEDFVSSKHSLTFRLIQIDSTSHLWKPKQKYFVNSRLVAISNMQLLLQGNQCLFTIPWIFSNNESSFTSMNM